MPISLGEWRVRIGSFVRWQQEPSYIKHVFVIQRPSANAETSNTKNGSSGDTNAPKNSSTCGLQPSDSCGKEEDTVDGGDGEARSGLGDGENHAKPEPSVCSSSKCDLGQRCSTPTNQSDSVGGGSSNAPRNDDHTAQPEVITTSLYIKGAHRQGCSNSASLPNSSGTSGGNCTPSLLPIQPKGISNCDITSDPVPKTLQVQGQILQKSTHDKGSGASHQENHIFAEITTPDTTQLLLLRSGDVESNPGPKRKHSQVDTTSETVNDFDDILKKVARGIAVNSEIDDLGKALGFEPADIQRYIQTNHRYQGVTFDGTLQMLRDWLKKQKHGDELPSLRDALQKAGLLRLADTFLPLNKPGSHAEGHCTPLSDALLDRVCEEIRRYYLLELCFIQPDPLNSDIFVRLGHIFTDLTLLEFEENMGVKDKTPLSYSELYNVKICGLEAKRLLVIGEAGVGKTTLCAKIALDWAERRTLVQCKLLVVILLRKAKDKTVGEIIKTYLSDSNPVESQQLDEYILSNPQDVFMVLDGLDEFDGDFSGLNQVVQIILNKVFKSGTVLITTRQWKLSLIRDIPHLRKVYAFIAVEGFSSENQSVYIKRFFQADTESSEQLISFIAVNDVIRENMASFPIYTAMLCVMWKEYDGERRQAMSKLKTFSQLFKEMIDFLIDHYLQKNVGEQRLTISNHLTLIGKVAFQGLLKRQLAFTEDTFQSCEESKEIGCEVGVLTRDKRATPRQQRRRNPQSESYMVQFPHKLFQEYLSAMFLTSLYRSDPQEYEKLMTDIMRKAREFQYLLYFISALEEKLGHDIVTGLIANKVDFFGICDNFIIDVTYESQFQSVAKEVAKQLDSTSSTLELGRAMSEHTVSGHLFVMKHQKQLDELRIQKSCGPNSSTDLAEFLCSSPSLRSVGIGSDTFPYVTMHDFFYSLLADSAQHSRIEKLKIEEMIPHSPVASCHLAQFICKMSHLKDLTLKRCRLHDDFYHTAASSRLSSQVVKYTSVMVIRIYRSLREWKQRVVIEGEQSEWATVDSGVLQGTVTGPLYFLIYINDLPNGLSSTCRLFADDCVIYDQVSSMNDAQKVQKDLDRLAVWQAKWQLDFNVQKCHVLHITHARNPIKYQYILNGSPLPESKSHTYLGVDISNDLTWNAHVDKTCAKANRTLGFLRRNLFDCTKKIKDMTYKTLVRPILDYCSTVWDPHTQLLTNKIEAIQNRAARFVTGDYSKFSSVTVMKQRLDWESLQLRRKVSRIATFREALAGRLSVPVQKALRPARRSLRNTSSQTYIPIATNKNCYKYSFIPRTIPDWNILTSPIIDIQRNDTFKKAVLQTLQQQSSH